MKPSDIDQALAEDPPRPTPRPGLATRIHAAVEAEATPRRGLPWWPALAGAAALALVLAVTFLPRDAAPLAEVPAEVPPTLIPELETKPPGNPLRSEAEAIGRQTRDAGRFLIDRLPSLAVSDPR